MTVTELRNHLDRMISSGRGSSRVVYGDGGAPVGGLVAEDTGGKRMANGNLTDDLVRITDKEPSERSGVITWPRRFCFAQKEGE